MQAKIVFTGKVLSCPCLGDQNPTKQNPFCSLFNFPWKFLQAEKKRRKWKKRKENGPNAVIYSACRPGYSHHFPMCSLFPRSALSPASYCEKPRLSCLSTASSSGIKSKSWSYYWGKWLFQRNKCLISGVKMTIFLLCVCTCTCTCAGVCFIKMKIERRL